MRGVILFLCLMLAGCGLIVDRNNIKETTGRYWVVDTSQYTILPYDPAAWYAPGPGAGIKIKPATLTSEEVDNIESYLVKGLEKYNEKAQKGFAITDLKKYKRQYVAFLQ